MVSHRAGFGNGHFTLVQYLSAFWLLLFLFLFLPPPVFLFASSFFFFFFFSSLFLLLLCGVCSSLLLVRLLFQLLGGRDGRLRFQFLGGRDGRELLRGSWFFRAVFRSPVGFLKLETANASLAQLFVFFLCLRVLGVARVLFRSRLGRNFGALGPHLGSILEAFSLHFGPLWPHLCPQGRQRPHKRKNMVHVGGLWGPFGSLWAPLGTLWASFGTPFCCFFSLVFQTCFQVALLLHFLLFFSLFCTIVGLRCVLLCCVVACCVVVCGEERAKRGNA